MGGAVAEPVGGEGVARWCGVLWGGVAGLGMSRIPQQKRAAWMVAHAPSSFLTPPPSLHTSYVTVWRNRSLKQVHQRRASESCLHSPLLTSPPGPQLDGLEEVEEENGGLDTTLKNSIMISLQDQQARSGMIDAIADKKAGVVETWKKYTKYRQARGSGDGVHQKRIENMSWYAGWGRGACTR